MTENVPTPWERIRALFAELTADDATSVDTEVEAPVVEPVVEVEVEAEPEIEEPGPDAEPEVDAEAVEVEVEPVVDYTAILAERDTRIAELEAANAALRGQLESYTTTGYGSLLDEQPNTTEEDEVEAYFASKN